MTSEASTTRVGPPPAAAPSEHPWAGTAQQWADEVNELQQLNPAPVFATVDHTGVHLAHWPEPVCPTCGGTTPPRHSWTVPPPEVGGVTWRWLHDCGQRWIPKVHVLRWAMIDAAVPTAAVAEQSHSNVTKYLTSWMLSERTALTHPAADSDGRA